jgi:hypothetical protein
MARISNPLLRIALALCVCTGTIPADTDALYSDNRSLFVLPAQAGVAHSSMAVAREATIVSNPGNLALGEAPTLSVAYAGYYHNTFSTSTVSYVTGLHGAGALGASISYLLMSNIEDTRGLKSMESNPDIVEYDLDNVRFRTGSETMVNVAYGRKLSFGEGIVLGIGGAVHAQRRRLIPETGYGVGLDAGATVVFTRSGLRLSVLANDLSTNYQYWSSEYKLYGKPAAFAGAGLVRKFPQLNSRLTLGYTSPDISPWGGINVLESSGSSEDGAEPERYSLTGSRGRVLLLGKYGVEYTISMPSLFGVMLKIPQDVSFRAGYDAGLKKVSFGGGDMYANTFSIDFSYITYLGGVMGDGAAMPGSYLASFSLRW